MAYCLVNGIAALQATVTMPRVGAWTADVVVNTDSPPAGPVTVAFGIDNSITLVGKAFRAGTSRGAVLLRLVGGAGGLSKTLSPKSYGQVALKIPLQELLAAAGEMLSPTADAALLALQLGAWVRTQGSASGALAALLWAQPSISWRVLPDGTVWAGSETWPASALVKDFQVTKNDPNHGRQEIAADLPAIHPGQTFNGGQVSGVEHHITAEKIRTLVFYEG